MQTFSQIYETHAKALLTAYDLENAGIPSSDINVSGVTPAHSRPAPLNGRSAWIGNASVGAAIGAVVGVLTAFNVFSAASGDASDPSAWPAVTLVGASLGALVGTIAGSFLTASSGNARDALTANVVRDPGTQVTVRTEKAASLVTAILKRHLTPEPLMQRRA